MNFLLRTETVATPRREITWEVYWEKPRTRTAWYIKNENLDTDDDEPYRPAVMIRMPLPHLVYFYTTFRYVLNDKRRSDPTSALYIYAAPYGPPQDAESLVKNIDIPNNTNPVCFGHMETNGLSARELVDLFWNSYFTDGMTLEEGQVFTPSVFGQDFTIKSMCR